MIGFKSDLIPVGNRFDLNISPYPSGDTVIPLKLANFTHVPSSEIEWWRHQGFNRDDIVLYYNAVYFSIETLEITKSTTNNDIIFTTWNAFFQDVTLTSVEIPHGSGLTFYATEGMSFKPLELKEWKFKVQKGTENTDDYITFRFSNGFVFKMKIIVVNTQYLILQPDKEIEEEITYKTEISQSYRKELRAKMGTIPRYQLTYKYVFDEALLAQVINDFQSQATENYIVPLWLYIFEADTQSIRSGEKTINLKAMSNYIRVGDNVAIMDTQNGVVGVVVNIVGNTIFLKDGITVNMEGNIFVIPCRNCSVFNGVEISRELNGLFDLKLKYFVKNHLIQFEQHEFPILEGLPVLNLYFEDGSIANKQSHRLIENTLLNPAIHVLQNRGLFSQQLSATVNRELWQKWLTFINYCSGRFKAFWMPTRTRDLRLTTEALKNNSFISVETNFALKENYGLMIELDGEINYYLIKNVTYTDNHTNLILNAALPKTIFVDSNYKISLLFRSRLNSDEIVIKHDDYYNKTITLDTIETL